MKAPQQISRRLQAKSLMEVLEQNGRVYRVRCTQTVLRICFRERERKAGEAVHVPHERRLYRDFLARLPAHSTIAVEASGHYSWLADEMEQLGYYPKLANPLEAKRRMGLTKETAKLDAKGLAILLRSGTLPEVWVPPSELRDQRELFRMRIFLVHLHTRVKNRIHGTLAPH